MDKLFIGIGTSTLDVALYRQAAITKIMQIYKYSISIAFILHLHSLTGAMSVSYKNTGIYFVFTMRYHP